MGRDPSSTGCASLVAHQRGMVKWLLKFLHDYTVGISVTATAFLAAAVAAKYQSLLKQADHSHVKLDPQSAFVAALPFWVVAVFTIAFLIIYAEVLLKISASQQRKLQAAKLLPESGPAPRDESHPAQPSELQRRLNDALLELAELRSKQSPALHGEIIAFEVDPRPMSSEEMRLYNSGVCYATHLEIENLGAPSRTRDWQFILFLENGSMDMGPLVLSKIRWSPPSSWPNIEYQTLDEVQSEYLQSGKVYHVFFHVVAGVLSQNIKSFEVHFKDGEGQEIICGQRKAASG